MALTDKLSAIGTAIREKTGKTDLMTLDQMPAEIAAIETGGSGDEGIPEEVLVITGNCTSRFAYNGWNWFIEKYGDKITTNNISGAGNMFQTADQLIEIPFDINLSGTYLANGFNGCLKLLTVPRINILNPNDTKAYSMNSLFNGCRRLRDAENAFDAENLNMLANFKPSSAYSSHQLNDMFSFCYSLRKVPSWFSKLRVSEESTVYPAASQYVYYSAFQQCYVLDEILNIPVLRCAAGMQTSNMFYNTFDSCRRVKNITFETQEDGTPYTVNGWNNQTIDLTNYVGYVYTAENTMYMYSDITEDDKVDSEATYEAKKNTENWYAYPATYSRYNHDSAVATINSLPDVSSGSSNIIKFQGKCGELTDGGAINTLTEEEIAVATAKGWTVSLV